MSQPTTHWIWRATGIVVAVLGVLVLLGVVFATID
jgi:hypothetical protein